MNEEDAMRGALYCIKTYIIVHFLDGEGRSGSVVMVRGSDLPLNEDALSGSQSSPDEIKVSLQTCDRNLSDWVGN